MIAMSTEARALKKAGVDIASRGGSRNLWEGVGRAWAGSSHSLKRVMTTRAPTWVGQSGEAGSGRATTRDILGMWTLVNTARRYSPSVYPRPERGELGRSSRLSNEKVLT